MTVLKMQCAFGADTALPRDRMMINPVFSSTGLLTDADALCEDLADGLTNLWGSREVHVKAYDAQGDKPVYPIGDAIRNEGQTPVSTVPRELAVCLSFYAGRNVPRQRGRLYIPAQAVVTQAQIGVRPPLTTLSVSLQQWVDLFANLGGVDIDWGVYSPTTDQFHKMSAWWVDDEWDIMRSRGQKSTDRHSASTGG